MSSPAANNIYRHAPRRNVAILAHQAERGMGNTRLLFPARTLRPLLLILVIVPDLDLDLYHAMVERHNVLMDLVISRDSPAVNQSRDCRLLMVVLDNSRPVRHRCATEGWPKSAESHPQALSPSCISDTARQTQVHVSGSTIHRLMPPNRVIYFSIDRDSFRRGGVADHVTETVTSAAEEIVSAIQKENLGINFAYRPISDTPTVFDIRYDPKLPATTLAQSFFPSDERPRWKLRISQTVVDSECNLYFLPNILAHEFAHILGLRHWNARTCEPGERSFHWPRTRRECRWSVMVTGVHPSEILFSAEDFRVIREMYSLPHGCVFAGREIIDVHP